MAVSAETRLLIKIILRGLKLIIKLLEQMEKGEEVKGL